MLSRSHGRMLEEMGALQRGASSILQQRALPAELAAIDTALGFFEGSGARHEADEEQSLFPRLRDRPELWPLLSDLVADHEHHQSLLGQLRSLRNRWPVSGPDAGAGASFAMAANELVRAYRQHIDREDRDLLPVAAELLTRGERDSLTTEMERRRGRAPQGPARKPAGAVGTRLR